MKEGLTNNDEDFFTSLKIKSEALWEESSLDYSIYGFQIQQGTKWNPGLSEEELNNYEHEVGFKFPNVLRNFFKTMNGLDKPTLNVFGNSDHQKQEGVSYYSYPQDIALVKQLISQTCKEFGITTKDMDGDTIPYILPIKSHRFIVIDKNHIDPILSMHGDDVIPYALTLQSFLLNDIFNNHKPDEQLERVKVNFWLD